MYYAVLTDGEIVYQSKVFSEEELARASESAIEATDGNMWWEKGDKENATYLKDNSYRYIKSVVDRKLI